MSSNIQQEFLDAMLNSEREEANSLIDRWVIEQSYNEAVIKIVEPALQIMGRMWLGTHDISFPQAFISAKIAEDILFKALNENSETVTQAKRGRIVMGSIEDDCHSIGRNLVSVFLRVAGWEVYDLGNDVQASEFIDKALEVDAKVISVSAMLYTTAINIKKLRREIDNRGLNGKIMLAVGGEIFNRRNELAITVGADGYSHNAIEASDMIEQLFEQVKKNERYNHDLL